MAGMALRRRPAPKRAANSHENQKDTLTFRTPRRGSGRVADVYN